MDLVTYTEETLNEKLHFLCSDGLIVTLGMLFQTYNILQYIYQYLGKWFILYSVNRKSKQTILLLWLLILLIVFT